MTTYNRYRQYRKNRRRYNASASAGSYALVILLFYACFQLFKKVVIIFCAGLLMYGMYLVLKEKLEQKATRKSLNCSQQKRREEVAMKMDKGTTEVGYINKNNQKNIAKTEEAGTDYGQKFYIMECQECGHLYKANGSDIWLKKCPKCQGGK